MTDKESSLLDTVPDKDRYLTFFVDFAALSRMHRSRVAEVLKCLLQLQSWQDITDSSPALCESVRSLLADCEAKQSKSPCVEPTSQHLPSATAGLSIAKEQQPAISTAGERPSKSAPTPWDDVDGANIEAAKHPTITAKDYRRDMAGYNPFKTAISPAISRSVSPTNPFLEAASAPGSSNPFVQRGRRPSTGSTNPFEVA